MLDQLKQEKEVGERRCAFEAEEGNEEASSVSLETPVQREASAELPCRITMSQSKGKGKKTSRRKHELFASASHQILRPSSPTLRLEAQMRRKPLPRQAHELSSIASHQVLHAIPEMSESSSGCSIFLTSRLRYQQLIRANDDYIKSTSRLRNGFDSQRDEGFEDELSELLSFPELPNLPVELAGSLSPRFSRPGTGENEDLSEPARLTPRTSSANAEPSPRAAEAIYRFGEPRVEAVPAIFRVPISGLELRFENEDPEFPLADVALKMDAWEWSSVPDLRLSDPREEEAARK